MNYIKVNKSKISLMEDKMNTYNEKTSIKRQKISDDNFIIPNIKNYNETMKQNYNVSQLKLIAKFYKIKITGLNKNELIESIYKFFGEYFQIVKIQKLFRGYIVRKYKFLHGPAAQNRKICTNMEDFITLESINEISFHNFISYKDSDNFIYGFNISSLYNLILNSKDKNRVLNPYNRNEIPKLLLNSIKSIIQLSKILNVELNLKYEDDTIISNEKMVELRALALFQNIDALGNYSNSTWFLSLTRDDLIKFVRELNDIWNYRAQLLSETKYKVCPPNGDPFRNMNIHYAYTEPDLFNVKKIVLEVLEKLVNSGVDNDSRTLGAYYVLSALTLVNEEAATSLPWLFQSVSHF
jgi:hypothetical protein